MKDFPIDSRGEIGRKKVKVSSSEMRNVFEGALKEKIRGIIREKAMIAGIHDKKETLVVLRDMLKRYGVPNTKIEWATYTNKYAHYDFDRDIIHISTVMNKDNKEFLISVCHEIRHAMDRKKFGGGDEYREKYEMEQNMQIYRNKHPYKNNKYEKRAEAFGQREWKKCSKRIGKIGVRK